MILKMLKIVFSFLLISGDCLAAGNPHLRFGEMLPILEQLSKLSVWKFDRDEGFGFYKIDNGGHKISVDPQTRMMVAVQNGDLHGIACVLFNNFDCLECPDMRGNVPLQRLIECIYDHRYRSSWHEYVECLRLLLDCGVNLNRAWYARNDMHRSAPLIFKTIELGEAYVVGMLLAYGAEAMVVDDGMSVFDCLDSMREEACIPNRKEAMQLLLEQHFFTLLWKAVQQKDANKFKKILSCVSRGKHDEMRNILTMTDDINTNLFQYAVAQGCREIVLMLFKVATYVAQTDIEAAQRIVAGQPLVVLPVDEQE